MLEIFDLVAALATKESVTPLCKLPGVWECKIDDSMELLRVEL
ncbi:hypothetical protein TthWC1_2389 [Thermoanaerobacter thermohydrosulfuricus WC1]|uniref:Uncharacterized protein n=1 Tax=Thermoanaerobacter thermohydrosulfuricus WC1 TaxID=1198630 RepID=M8CLL0_THETY|nr:hypothetical protein TthWC1_2389 [Thermoanaerobacter thermohydrosulfuricus WC1]